MGRQRKLKTQYKNQMEQLQPFVYPKGNVRSASYISGTVLDAGNIKISWTWSLPSTCNWKMRWREIYIADTRTEMGQVALGTQQ